MGIYTTADIRKSWGKDWTDASDEEVIQAYAKGSGMDPVEVANKVGYDSGDGGLTSKRVSASVDSYQAGMYGLGEAVTGSEWMANRRRANEFQADVAQSRAKALGGIDSYKDVDGFGSAANYVGGLAVQSLPYLGEAAVGGLGVRAASTGLRAAARAGSESAAKSLATRQMVGGGVASYPSSAADILGNQREQLRENGQDDSNTNVSAALLGAAPYAALNILSPTNRLASTGSISRIVSGLDNMKNVRGGLTRLGANAGVAAGLEGANEMGQEFINQGFGRMAVDPNETFFNDKSIDRFKESFVGGAALGGVMGGGAGGWRRSSGYVDPRAQVIEQGGSSDLTTTQGFENLARQRPAAPNPLGDLTPEWETSPGANSPTNYEGGVDPTGLHRAFDEPHPNTGVNPLGSSLQMPVVPGRPGQADAMQVGPITEVAGTDADNQALQDPGTQEAIRQFNAQRVAQQQEAEQQAAKQKRFADLKLDPAKHVGFLGQLDALVARNELHPDEIPMLAKRINEDHKVGEVLSTAKTLAETRRLISEGKLDPNSFVEVGKEFMAGGNGSIALEVAKDRHKQLTAEVKQQQKDAAKEVEKQRKESEKAAKTAAVEADRLKRASEGTTQNKPHVIPTPLVAPTAPAPAATGSVQPAAPVQPKPVASQPAAVPAVKPARRVTGMGAVVSGEKGAKVAEVKAEPSTPKSGADAAKEELQSAAAKLKAFMTKGPSDPTVTHLGAGPTVHPELHSILVDMVSAAMKLGYHSVKDAVAHVRKTIIEVLGKAEADKITDGHIKAARAEAGRFKPAHKAVVNGYVDLDLLHSAMDGREDLEKAIRYYMLIDDDGSHIPAEEVGTLGAAAERAGLGNTNHAQLSKIKTQLGITDAVLDRIQITHYADSALGESAQAVEEQDTTVEPGRLLGKKRTTLSLHDRSTTARPALAEQEYGEQQAFSDGELFADGEDVEDSSDADIKVEHREGVNTISGVGHSTKDGLRQGKFTSKTNRAYRALAGNPITEVPTADLLFALQNLYSYATPDSLPLHTSKAVRTAAEGNLVLRNIIKAEYDRRLEAGELTGAGGVYRRKMQASGEMFRTKAETERQQAAREKKEAAEAADEQENNDGIQRDRKGNVLREGTADNRTVPIGVVPDDQRLPQDVQPTASGKPENSGRENTRDGKRTKAAEDEAVNPGEGLKTKGTVTIEVNGVQHVIDNPGRTLQVQGEHLDKLKALLKCLIG